MDLFDRIFKLHHTISQARYPVSQKTLQNKLGCSRATVARCIRDLRACLFAPIEYDKTAKGYHYAPTGERPYELPGLWFNASELQALLAIQRLLADIQPGLLESHLAPVRTRIENILKSKHLGIPQAGKRIKLISMASRCVEPEHFQAVVHALLHRKQLRLHYHSRSQDANTQRVVSPQRLIRYRDNWYLDAWDHAKCALRSFAIDRIQSVQQLNPRSREISPKNLDNHFSTAYGIFAGKPKQIAVLRFTPERARWIADERWHPQQKSRYENGFYILEVPYSDHRELVMDILKHAPEVEVLAPKELQTEVLKRLEQAVNRQKKVGAEK